MRGVIFDRRSNLFDQVITPFTAHRYLGGVPEITRLNQIVVHAGANPGLQEFMKHRTGRASTDEPCFRIAFQRAIETAGLPDKIAIPAYQVRAGIAVGLRMHEQHLFAPAMPEPTCHGIIGPPGAQ